MAIHVDLDEVEEIEDTDTDPDTPSIALKGVNVVFGIFMILFGLPFVFAGGGIALSAGITTLLEGDLFGLFLILFSLPFIGAGLFTMYMGIKMIKNPEFIKAATKSSTYKPDAPATEGQKKLIEIKSREIDIETDIKPTLTQAEARHILKGIELQRKSSLATPKPEEND